MAVALSAPATTPRFSLIRAIALTFWIQFRLNVSVLGSFSLVLSSLATAIVVAVVAGRSGDPALVTYIAFGVALMTIWNSGVFRIGWSLSNEMRAGLLEQFILTRTPLIAILFGKALAIEASALLGALVVSAIVILTSRTPVVIGDLPLLIVSLVVAAAALTAASFVFAPLSVVLGAQGGFFNAIMPFGVAFSGFIYPVGILPAALQPIAWLLPTSWAMLAVRGAISGDTGTVLRDLLLAVLLAAGYVALTFWLFAIVERRVRSTGSLARY